jgi:hypothetical protein
MILSRLISVYDRYSVPISSEGLDRINALTKDLQVALPSFKLESPSDAQHLIYEIAKRTQPQYSNERNFFSSITQSFALNCENLCIAFMHFLEQLGVPITKPATPIVLVSFLNDKQAHCALKVKGINNRYWDLTAELNYPVSASDYQESFPFVFEHSHKENKALAFINVLPLSQEHQGYFALLDELIRLDLTYPSKDTLRLKKMQALYNNIKGDLASASLKKIPEQIALFEELLKTLSKDSFISKAQLASYQSFVDFHKFL